MGAPGAKNLNTFENAYAWLMRDVGEHAVAVRVYRDRQDPRLETATASASTQVDASALIRLPRVVVVPAYSHQKLADTDTDNTIQTGGLECNVLLDPTARWMLTGRYEQQHVTSSDGSPADNLRLATANLSYYVSINAKVGLDYSRISDHLAATHTDVMQAFFFVGY